MSTTDLDTHKLTRSWSSLLHRARGICSCGATFAVYVHDFPSVAAGHDYAIVRVGEMHREHIDLIRDDPVDVDFADVDLELFDG